MHTRTHTHAHATNRTQKHTSATHTYTHTLSHLNPPQVTYLEPYLSDAQAKLRETDFERNVNINQFVYETPFTRTGKARGTLEEQWRRRSFVTVDHCFPYMKTRLAILDVSRKLTSSG